MKTASAGRVSHGLEVLRWRSCTPGHVLLAGRGLQCRDPPSSLAASPPFSWQWGQLGHLTVQENTGFTSHQQRKTSFFSAHGQKGRRLRGANTWLLPYHRAWGHFVAPRGLRAGSATSASPCPPGRCAEVQPSGSGLNPGWGCCTRSALFCELTICFPNGLWEPTVS